MPYSAFGVGYIDQYHLIPANGMGGTGNAIPMFRSINLKNPSLSVYDSIYTSFDAGFIGEFKTISSEAASVQGGGANPRFFSLAFPVVKGNWTAGLGFKPYSNVNFAQQNIIEEQFSSRAIERQGIGGISDVYMTHGVRLFHGKSEGDTKVTSYTAGAGFRLSYLFGGVLDELSSTTQILGQGAPTSVSFSENINYAGFTYQFSGHYKYDVDEQNEDFPKYYSIGLTFTPAVNLGTVTNRSFERSLNGVSRPDFPGDTTIDSNIISDLEGNVRLPSSFGFGVGYGRLAKFSAGLDIDYTRWSEFRYANGNADSLLTDRLRLSAGVSFSPDPTSLDSYLNRATYRFGTFFENSLFRFDENQINNFGLTLGASFPIMDRVSAINTGITFGFMGNEQNGLLREQYIQIQFGITFNDVWFRKYRYD